MPVEYIIRPAAALDAETLTAIAFASKRYWNYPESYFSVWKDELTITTEYIEKNRVFIAEQEQRPVAFYSVVEVSQDLQLGEVFVPKGHWLDHMFVLPEFIGRGLGRRLMQHAVSLCREIDVEKLFIFSDPYARGFYDRMGALYIKEVSSSIAGRTVSLFTVSIKPEVFPEKSGAFVIDHLPRHPELVSTVAHWIYQAFIDPDQWSFDAIVQLFATRSMHSLPMTWIALDQGICVGTVSLFTNDLKTRPQLSPWLAALYVQPEHRSRGVAAHLISSVISECRLLGYTKLYLRTEHTAEYYRQRGWNFVEMTHDLNGQETAVFNYEIK